jgi:hypothetical protein
MSGETLDQPFELEHAERGHDLAGGHAGAGDEIVDSRRMIVQVSQERSFRVGKCQLGRVTHGWFLWIGANFLNQGTKLFHDVVDRFDQAGTVADQAMAAPAGQAIGRARDREDFAILFHGVRRGRERPAARGRFDDQDTEGQSGYDPVALGEQTWVTIGASGPCG